MEEITYEKVMMNEASNAIIQCLNYDLIQSIPEHAQQTYIPPHWHRSIEFSLVRHGQIHLYVNDEKKLVQDGEFIFVNSAQVHRLIPVNKNLKDYEVLLVIISYDFIKKVLPNIDELCFDIDQDKPSKKRIHEIYDFFYRHCIHPQEYDELCINAYLQELLYLLVRDYQANEEKRKMFLAQRKQHRILEYIEQHYTEDLSLSEMAARFYLNEDYFSRLFKKMFGMNYKKYVTDYRLYQAYQSLMYTDESIQDIAGRHGFPSTKSFISYFKEAYGITPLQYRKKYQNI